MESSALDFRGRRIVISGAASGIGLATAKLAHRLGAEVVLWDLAGTIDLTKQIGGKEGRVQGVECDVGRRDLVEREAARVGPVFAVVCCAGLCPLDDWAEPDFDDTFDQTLTVNVKGIINLVRAFLPGMERLREGRVVMLGSVSGRTASVSGVHYAASKGAVHSLVRWLAIRSAASNVLVNGIAPGPIATQMIAGREATLAARIPLGRVGSPEEIAWPIMFLCSPMASFMTGSILDVNGGIFIG